MADTNCKVDIPIISSAFMNKEGIEILSSIKAPRYVDYINVLFGRVFSQEYLNNDSYITLSDLIDDNDKVALSKNGDLIILYNKVKDQLNKDIESNYYDSLPISTVNDILKIYKNWDLFASYHSSYNAFILSKGMEDELSDDYTEKEYFDKKGNEYNEFELVSNEVRTLFKFLPKAEFVTDARGNAKIEESYDPTTGLPLRGDFENIFKLTLDALKGIKDEAKFIETLTSEDLLKKIPELDFLFKILPLRDGGQNNLSNKQRLLFNKVYMTFSRDYIPIHASTRMESENKEELPTHIRYKSAKGNIDKISRQFISNFASNQEESQYIKIDTSEDEKNPEKAGYGRKRLYSLPSKLSRIELTDDQISSLSISKIQSQYKDYFNFFKVLGIEFSDLSLLKSNKDKANLIKILNSALTIHDNISSRLKVGDKIYNPILDTEEQFMYLNPDTNKPTRIASLRNVIKEIVKFEGIFSKISPTTMSRGASGEKQSDISLANAISIAANEISNASSLAELYDKPYFKKLKYNPLHTNSFVATEIIGTKNKYSLENYSGHVIESGDDTINSDTKNLSDVEKFKSDFNNLMGWGIINTPQLEAKSGYFALKFLNENEKAIIPFSISNFNETFLNDGTKFFNQILSYLKGELQRVKDYPELKKSSYNVPEAYGQLHIFKGIVSDEQLKTLLTTEWDSNSAIIQEIKPNIEEYFQKQLDELNNFIEKNSITNLISKEALKNNDLTEELYRESPDEYKNLLLRSFIANDFIHNVEFGIFVSGDPLFYKDWHKRLGGLASTGIQSANTENLRAYFRSDSEKIYWETYSLRGILNQTAEKPVARRDNFNTFLSAVLAEDTVKSDTAYHNPQTVVDYIHSEKLKTGKTITPEQAINELQINSLKIDVGDGQGYLNMDAHRELSIKQDTYRPQHDVSYRYEALIFKRDILGRKLTDDEQAEYIKVQGQIIRNPDKYALPILKQTYYGTLANGEVELDAKVFDKFSLAPLLPSIAKNHPKLVKLLLAMAERQIHYVKYQSGTKGYVRDVFNNTSDLLNEKIPLDELQSDLLKLQITPSKKEKVETKIPTQMIKLIFTNLFDKGNASENVKNLRNEFIQNLNNIQSTNKKYILSKLGFEVGEDGKIKSWDKAEIVERIIEQINFQNLPANLLESLKIDSTGNFINTIESSGIYQQILNYVTGKLDSSLREFKVNGGDFVLLSESMFATPLKYFRLNKNKTKIEPLECRVTLTREFSKLLELPDPKHLNKKIGTIDRLNELLNNRDFTNRYDKELTITFSRPPVQGPNSMGVGKVVEFFSPTAGNILQLPKEFMHQAGIDFDYDKEKVLLPSLNKEGIYLSDESITQRLKELDNHYSDLREIFNQIDEHLEESEYTNYEDLEKDLLTKDNFTKLFSKIFNVEDDKELNDVPGILGGIEDIHEKVKEYMSLKYASKALNNNKLLQSIISSLQLPELYSELILPNAITTVKPLAEENGREINNLNTLPIGNNVYSYQQNLKVFKMFNDAKALLGPFALQNTFSQLIAPLNIMMSLDYAYNDKGRPTRRVNNLLLNNKSREINISKREDEQGNNKQHINSEFINATVDSAKDPYFANFMLSFDNINPFMFMVNMGYPINTIVDFTSSAIVRKYIDVKTKNPGIKTDDVIRITLKESGLKVRNNVSLLDMLKTDEANINKDNTELLSKLKNLKKDSSLNEENYLKHHVDLLANFISLEQHAKQLSSFKSLFKNDTNKITSLFEIFSKENLRKNVIADAMFSEEDIAKIENHSTITAFRNEGIIEDVLKSVFPIVSEDRVALTLGNLFTTRKGSLTDNESRILSQIITNDYIGAILFSYGNYKNQSIYEYAKDLVRKRKNVDGVFNVTLLERIHKFKQNKEYPELLEEFSVLGKIVGNVSTKAIKGNPIYNGKFGFNLLLDVDPNVPLIEKENYMNQFKQLIDGDFETKDPNIKEALVNFIKDFFIAGLIQSGFNKTGISYLEYIPINFTQQLLQPALNFYNHEKRNSPGNFDIFLKEFAKRFVQNNPNYFYILNEDKKSSVKSSYLGKMLRVINYGENDLLNYNRSGATNDVPIDNTIDNSVIGMDNTGQVLIDNTIAQESKPKHEFSYQSKSISTEFELGVEQREGLEKLIDFVKSYDDEDDVITLQGSAGTGKTSLIGYLQKYLGSKYSFAYLAPTHAATAELAFATVKTGNTVLPSTLQSAVTVNSYTKRHVFTQKIQKMLGYKPVIVLDESSMVDDNDINNLKEAIKDVGGKLILLGDEKQISKVVTDNVASKNVSPAFTDYKQINLSKIFRQSNNNLLSLLSMIREQTDFKLFKVDNSDNVKFLDKKEYNRELIKDLVDNPENTVIISYTNSSVKGINISARRVLGREGQTQKGDVVIGYLGYASKQIEKGDVANSVLYTIDKISENGSARKITAKSSKLAKLIDLGLNGISDVASTTYYQLSLDDSLIFDGLKSEDFEKNNEEVSKIFRKIHKANEDYKEKSINYASYLGLLAGYSDTLRKYSVGNDYVYNPTTDVMEKYDLRKHKSLKTNGNGSLLFNKDIDYGHAITIHKSQGSTIDNVYFDSNSLKSAQNTPIVDREGKKITTEKQSLAYVAMSRSKNKLVVYEGDNQFEKLDTLPEKQLQQPSKESENSIYSQLGDKTVSGNVQIESWSSLKDQEEPYTRIYGSIVHIIATRIKGSDEHFGNPFSHDPEGKSQGLIKTETIKEAVEKYTNWVINSQDKRAEWIREQIKSGELKDKPILYYKELGEPSHATALDYLINKYDWNKSNFDDNVNIKDPSVSISLTPINIYSTEKNGYEKLSNLLNGPIKIGEFTFKTVEHLFQWKKAEFAGDAKIAGEIFNAKTGWDAQKLGRKVKDLNIEKWDKVSSKILEDSMRQAFEQNNLTRNLLLSTGNVLLTHKVNANLGKWETEFPAILMKIRNEILKTPSPTEERNDVGELSEYYNHSGGANGSDLEWDTMGKAYGFNNHFHYYIGEKGQGNAPNGNTELKENSVEYQEGRFEAAKAAQVTFGYQYSAMKDARLIRNWAQVKHSDAVFAIGHIVAPGERLFPDIPNDTRLALVPAVTGGTGYAVQMAINHGKPVYVFDQQRKSWAKNVNGVWSKITEAPVLTKNYAGIGTRNINADGITAIAQVYENTIKAINDNKLSEEDKKNLDNAGFKESDKCD